MDIFSLIREVGRLKGEKERRDKGLNAALGIGASATSHMRGQQRQAESQRYDREQGEISRGFQRERDADNNARQDRNVLAGIKREETREAERKRDNDARDAAQRATQERFERSQAGINERFEANERQQRDNESRRIAESEAQRNDPVNVRRRQEAMDEQELDKTLAGGQYPKNKDELTKTPRGRSILAGINKQEEDERKAATAETPEDTNRREKAQEEINLRRIVEGGQLPKDKQELSKTEMGRSILREIESDTNREETRTIVKQDKQLTAEERAKAKKKADRQKAFNSNEALRERLRKEYSPRIEDPVELEKKVQEEFNRIRPLPNVGGPLPELDIPEEEGSDNQSAMFSGGVERVGGKGGPGAADSDDRSISNYTGAPAIITDENEQNETRILREQTKTRTYTDAGRPDFDAFIQNLSSVLTDEQLSGITEQDKAIVANDPDYSQDTFFEREYKAFKADPEGYWENLGQRQHPVKGIEYDDVAHGVATAGAAGIARAGAKGAGESILSDIVDVPFTQMTGAPVGPGSLGVNALKQGAAKVKNANIFKDIEPRAEAINTKVADLLEIARQNPDNVPLQEIINRKLAAYGQEITQRQGMGESVLKGISNNALRLKGYKQGPGSLEQLKPSDIEPWAVEQIENQGKYFEEDMKNLESDNLWKQSEKASKETLEELKRAAANDVPADLIDDLEGVRSAQEKQRQASQAFIDFHDKTTNLSKLSPAEEQARRAAIAGNARQDIQAPGYSDASPQMKELITDSVRSQGMPGQDNIDVRQDLLNGIKGANPTALAKQEGIADAINADQRTFKNQLNEINKTIRDVTPGADRELLPEEMPKGGGLDAAKMGEGHVKGIQLNAMPDPTQIIEPIKKLYNHGKTIELNQAIDDYYKTSAGEVEKTFESHNKLMKTLRDQGDDALADTLETGFRKRLEEQSTQAIPFLDARDIQRVVPEVGSQIAEPITQSHKIFTQDVANLAPSFQGITHYGAADKKLFDALGDPNIAAALTGKEKIAFDTMQKQIDNLASILSLAGKQREADKYLAIAQGVLPPEYTQNSAIDLYKKLSREAFNIIMVEPQLKHIEKHIYPHLPHGQQIYTRQVLDSLRGKPLLPERVGQDLVDAFNKNPIANKVLAGITSIGEKVTGFAEKAVDTKSFAAMSLASQQAAARAIFFANPSPPIFNAIFGELNSFAKLRPDDWLMGKIDAVRNIGSVRKMLAEAGLTKVDDPVLGAKNLREKWNGFYDALAFGPINFSDAVVRFPAYMGARRKGARLFKQGIAAGKLKGVAEEDFVNQFAYNHLAKVNQVHDLYSTAPVLKDASAGIIAQFARARVNDADFFWRQVIKNDTFQGNLGPIIKYSLGAYAIGKMAEWAGFNIWHKLSGANVESREGVSGLSPIGQVASDLIDGGIAGGNVVWNQNVGKKEKKAFLELLYSATTFAKGGIVAKRAVRNFIDSDKDANLPYVEPPLTPKEAMRRMTGVRTETQVNRANIFDAMNQENEKYKYKSMQDYWKKRKEDK